MKYKPPKKINMWYGYRTSLSTSNERVWHLAQKHSTKAMFKYSFMMMFIGLFSGVYIITDKYVAALLLLELILIVLSHIESTFENKCKKIIIYSSLDLQIK